MSCSLEEVDEQPLIAPLFTNSIVSDIDFIQSIDPAETALFAYTMINYPNRLETEIEEWVTTNLPNCYAFLETIF